MYFNGPYLRILTVKTTNGIIPLTVNGEIQYKESFAPLTAKKQFEKKAARLNKNGHGHLAPIVEVVGNEEVKPKVQPTGEVQSQAPAPQKPNPKPRKKS